MRIKRVRNQMARAENKFIPLFHAKQQNSKSRLQNKKQQ